MLPDYREDENVQNRSNCSDGSDCEIVQSVQNSDFTFNPLTPNVRKAICDRLSMPFHKADLKHDNIGEKLFNRNNNNNRLFPICLQISCFNHLHFLIPVSENGMSLNLAVIF